ncbi:PASTA domain-containing protein [Streptomyces avermitilis]|uniref:PASTA domain-containing protein n=1 Tax=Streptomyces avermitilis TaxID=33903 RepID=UPI0033D64842
MPMQRAGKSVVRRLGILLVCALVLSGCDRGPQLLAVKAVAARVPSLAPFFDEESGLGHDSTVRSQQPRSGLQAGNTPGLYGGTRKPTICDVNRLKTFLTDPRNDRKAHVWAQVLKISQDEIPAYLDRLTPVLLRHDTLVQNHDYKKGRATPFNSLLEAGIAILVDEQGLPAVKCSCGNPLRPFAGDASRISVTFENGNKKWDGYDRASLVAVKPAPRRIEQLALVDVDNPDRGITRPAGTTGAHDSPFDTHERHKVPDVAGMRFGDASQRLADKGLAAAYDAKGPPPDGAPVTGSDPAPGTELEFGEYVTLSVDRGATGGTGKGSAGGTSAPPSSGSTTPGGSSQLPPSSGGATTSSSPPPSSSPSSSPPPPSSSPPSSATSGGAPGASKSSESSGSPESSRPPPASSASASSPPPAVSSSPPMSRPVSSAPVTSAPVTSAPVTSDPATAQPVTSDPVASDPVASSPVAGEPTTTTA